MRGLRGIRAIRSRDSGVVDDDNVLDSDYLEQVVKASAEWPMLGAFSGQCGRASRNTAEWTRPYWRRLAINEFDRDSWSNVPCLIKPTPNGAGLCVHRRVATDTLLITRTASENRAGSLGRVCYPPVTWIWRPLPATWIGKRAVHVAETNSFDS